MKSFVTPITFVALVCMVCILPAEDSMAVEHEANLDAELEALMAVDEAWSESVSDINEFLSYFADDALFMPPGAPLAQGEAIRANMEQLLASPGFELKWSATSAEIADSGELGYTVGGFTLTLEHEGALMATVGKYVTVWNKQEDGSWKVQVDCFNADGPPVATGAP